MKALISLLQRVAETVERHAMFAGARRIGVAVSGGADSVCLLYALLELAPRWDLCLSVLHLDHQLRGKESSADAEFVADLARGLDLPLVSRSAAIAREGNLEQNARRARRAFFAQAIGSSAVERVAVGHTRSDQAETVLFRLLRGAGAAGLSGILPVTREGIVRPLIEVERPEVERFLRERGIGWREDSTNTDRRFSRNRLRHDLLPQLKREWNPEVVAALARTAEMAAADEDYWRVEVESFRLSPSEGSVIVESAKLAGLPDAVARRVVRRAIELAQGDLRGIDFHHVEEVLRLARRSRGSGRVHVRELDICRSFNQIRFGMPPAVPYCYGLHLPGVAAGLEFSLELIEKKETSGDSDYVYNVGMGLVDWGRLSGSLTLRSWQPGDRYHPMNSSGVQKFKDLFQKARIPLWERSHWPVLVDGDAIVWTRRFGTAAQFAVGPDTRTVLRIRESGCPDTASNELSAAGTEVS
jgi:tRNA(Ile)-lysidine synthase